MIPPTRNSAGFGLAEIVIAMFLLGIIAVAILPALWQGIIYSSEQSTVATATRHLNLLVEEARSGVPTCDSLDDVVAQRNFEDGAGNALYSEGTVTGCGSGATAHVYVKVATASDDTVVADTDALVFVK